MKEAGKSPEQKTDKIYVKDISIVNECSPDIKKILWHFFHQSNNENNSRVFFFLSSFPTVRKRHLLPITRY